MRFSSTIFTLLALGLTACSSAEQKPENRWEVKVKKESDNRVWVTRADGSRQCEQAKSVSPQAAAQELVRTGVVVFNSRTGNDGKMRVTKCGAPTGNTVEHEISEMDLRRVGALGYKVMLN